MKARRRISLSSASRWTNARRASQSATTSSIRPWAWCRASEELRARREHVDLSGELARAVIDHGPLDAADGLHDLDRAREHDEERYRAVPLIDQHVAGIHLPYAAMGRN